MKSPAFKLIALVGLVVGAGIGTYFWKTAPMREMLCCEQPELAWVQSEFKVDPKDMSRVAELHKAYLAQCGELCMRIEATNALVRKQLEADGKVTPEVEKLLG